MKKIMLGFVFLFVFLNCVYAAPLEIQVNPQNITAKPFTTANYKLTITNNQDVNDSFLISLSGENLFWRMTGVILKKIDANSSDTVNMVFYPTDGYRGVFEYIVTVSSTTNPEIKASKKIYLEVPPDLKINNFSVTKEGNVLDLKLRIYSIKEKNLKIEFRVKDSKGNVIASDSVMESINGNKLVTKQIKMPDNVLAGEYTAEAKIEGTNLSVSKSFSVPEVHNVVKKREVKENPLYKQVRLVITNEGNVPEKNYRITESSSIDFMTGLVTLPEKNCYDREGKRICEYVIDEIQPGESKEVTYTISYLPTYTVYIVLLLLALGFVFFSFFRAAKPKINKKHIKKSENRHSIVLEIKNPFYHYLKDVVVKDWVSPLGHVLSDEIKAVKPVIKRLETGTELVWNLGSMKPREERVLTYDIKTLVQGSLKMPRAKAKMVSKDGRKIKISSNPLIIE
ncbi:MAG: hypothetical protein DRP16_03185 [Candidatus Aenigmatarchaeota archaeon]|nr:MAG: hypothetical protein DRP16_03185 [Candidatus Aenigmarchaeota archaeon]